jgi:hypothetical protein
MKPGTDMRGAMGERNAQLLESQRPSRLCFSEACKDARGTCPYVRHLERE